MAEGETPDKITITSKKNDNAKSIGASTTVGCYCWELVGGLSSSFIIFPRIAVHTLVAVPISSSLKSFSFGHADVISIVDTERLLWQIADSPDESDDEKEVRTPNKINITPETNENAKSIDTSIRAGDCNKAKKSANIPIPTNLSRILHSYYTYLYEEENFEDLSKTDLPNDIDEEHWTVRAIYSGNFNALSPDVAGQINTVVFKDVLLGLIPNLEKLLKQLELLNSLIQDDTKRSPSIGDLERQDPDYFSNRGRIERRVVMRLPETEFKLEVIPTLDPDLDTLGEKQQELALLKEVITKSLNYVIKSFTDIIAWCLKELGNRTVSESNSVRVKEYAEAIFKIVIKFAHFKRQSLNFIGNFVVRLDIAGMNDTMSVRTQIALWYGRILYELLILNSNFERDVVRCKFASKF